MRSWFLDGNRAWGARRGLRDPCEPGSDSRVVSQRTREGIVRNHDLMIPHLARKNRLDYEHVPWTSVPSHIFPRVLGDKSESRTASACLLGFVVEENPKSLPTLDVFAKRDILHSPQLNRLFGSL
jgi:hypothetical protein